MKFNLIYADPPWLYDNGGTQSSRGMARSAFECMDVDDLAALRVDSIAADDCMLALWATMPKLREALKVIDAWGFKYITCGFAWMKINRNGIGIYSGLGHWVNGNAELVLFGRKGHPYRAAKNVKQIVRIEPPDTDIVVASVASHSTKPRIVYSRLEELFGDVPKVELFARERREGWTTIGNGIDGKDIVVAINELAAQEAP